MVDTAKFDIQLHHDIRHQIVTEFFLSVEVLDEANRLHTHNTVGQVLEIPVHGFIVFLQHQDSEPCAVLRGFSEFLV